MSSDHGHTFPWMFHSGAGRRRVDYLRLSITDRCNERCLYCLPEQFTDWKSREEILTYEEILQVVRASLSLGFRHYRVTGGEPLIRRDAVSFIEALCALEGVENVHLSTNATRLAECADRLKRAGVKSINVSLDSLREEVYRRITGGDLKEALKGLQAASAAGLERIKLNCVLMRGINEEDLWPLIQFGAEHGWPIRFIELMPVSLTTVLTEENFLSVGEVMNRLQAVESLLPMNERLGVGPARYYRLEKTGAVVGFIGAITHLHFCEDCNKIRLTADGKIRPCLGNHGEFDIKPALREQQSLESILAVFQQAMGEKPPEHLFRQNYSPGRIMTAIGG